MLKPLLQFRRTMSGLTSCLTSWLCRLCSTSLDVVQLRGETSSREPSARMSADLERPRSMETADDARSTLDHASVQRQLQNLVDFIVDTTDQIQLPYGDASASIMTCLMCCCCRCSVLIEPLGLVLCSGSSRHPSGSKLKQSLHSEGPKRPARQICTYVLLESDATREQQESCEEVQKSPSPGGGRTHDIRIARIKVI